MFQRAFKSVSRGFQRYSWASEGFNKCQWCSGGFQGVRRFRWRSRCFEEWFRGLQRVSKGRFRSKNPSRHFRGLQWCFRGFHGYLGNIQNVSEIFRGGPWDNKGLSGAALELWIIPKWWLRPWQNFLFLFLGVTSQKQQSLQFSLVFYEFFHGY